MKIKQVFDGIFPTIFWVWNLTFLSIVYLGILPILAVPLVMATIDGIIPLEFSLTMAATIAVPTVCTVIGARRFRKQPLELMRWFYGVEAPLLLLCALQHFQSKCCTAIWVKKKMFKISQILKLPIINSLFF